MTSLQTTDQLLRSLKTSVQNGDVRLVRKLFERLFDSQTTQYPYRALAEFLVYFAATPKGSLSGCWGEMEELVYQNNWTADIPAPATINEHIAAFDQEPLPLNLTFNDHQMWHAIDGLLRLVVQVAQDLFDLVDGSFYVTFDVTPMPFYGEIVEEKIEDEWVIVGVASPSGKAATPQFKTDDKGKSSPIFKDTIWGHNYLVVCIHHWATRISFPIAIRYVGDFNRDAQSLMDELISVLEHYPRPDWIFADRGFCNAIVTGALAKYCADKPPKCEVDTRFAIPMKGQRDPGENSKSLRKTPRMLARDLFPYSKEMPGTPGSYFAVHPWIWTTDPLKRDHRVVFLYRQRTNGEPLSEIDTEGRELDLDEDMVVTMFITNKVVDAANVDEFNGLYGARWAIENLFKRHKRRAARSPSETEFWRFLSFGLSMTLYACYGLWRWNRCKTLELPFDDPKIYENRYLAAVRDAVLPKPEQA